MKNVKKMVEHTIYNFSFKFQTRQRATDKTRVTKMVWQNTILLKTFFCTLPYSHLEILPPSAFVLPTLYTRESGNLTRSNSARASKKDLIVHCARQFNQVNNGSHFKDFAKYSFCFAYYGPQEEWQIDNFVWTMKRQMLVFIAIMYDQGDAALYIVGLWSSSSGCIIGRDTV